MFSRLFAAVKSVMPAVKTAPAPAEVAQAILDIARAELGKSEEPKNSNWGPHVKKYLASVKINFPAPWCMGFVQFCVLEGLKKFRLKTKLFNSGHVLTVYNKSKALVVKDPKPGDIFIMKFSNGNGHTGFVERVEGDRIFTIEGNSNDEGSREGYEVCRKPGGRKISSIHAFIRVI